MRVTCGPSIYISETDALPQESMLWMLSYSVLSEIGFHIEVNHSAHEKTLQCQTIVCQK